MSSLMVIELWLKKGCFYFKLSDNPTVHSTVSAHCFFFIFLANSKICKFANFRTQFLKYFHIIEIISTDLHPISIIWLIKLLIVAMSRPLYNHIIG